jgi:hypothetical protein
MKQLNHKHNFLDNFQVNNKYKKKFPHKSFYKLTKEKYFLCMILSNENSLFYFQIDVENDMSNMGQIKKQTTLIVIMGQF